MVANRAKHHIINMIVLQEELPIILIVEITLETQIKGHQTHKNIWTAELGEYVRSPMQTTKCCR